MTAPVQNGKTERGPGMNQTIESVELPTLHKEWARLAGEATSERAKFLAENVEAILDALNLGRAMLALRGTHELRGRDEARLDAIAEMCRRFAASREAVPSLLAELKETEIARNRIAELYAAEVLALSASTAENSQLRARVEELEGGESGDEFWLLLHEPGCVPERKGPWPRGAVAAVLREFIAARPTAYIDMLTWTSDGPQIEHGPEVLQMLDGRSMGVGRRHNEQTRAAHAEHHSALSAAQSRAEAAEREPEGGRLFMKPGEDPELYDALVAKALAEIDRDLAVERAEAAEKMLGEVTGSLGDLLRCADDADEVHRWGLLDCRDNAGQFYQSADLAATLKRASEIQNRARALLGASHVR